MNISPLIAFMNHPQNEKGIPFLFCWEIKKKKTPCFRGPEPWKQTTTKTYCLFLCTCPSSWAGCLGSGWGRTETSGIQIFKKAHHIFSFKARLSWGLTLGVWEISNPVLLMPRFLKTPLLTKLMLFRRWSSLYSLHRLWISNLFPV